MSRFTVSSKNKKIVYGFDDMIGGYFLEVYGPDGVDIGEEMPIELEWSTNPLLCLSPIGKMKNQSQILEKMVELNLPRNHIERIALDLPYD